MSDEDTTEKKVYRIDLSPRYRYLKEKGGGGSDGGGMSAGPKTVVLEEWEIGVVLTALSHELRVTIQEADGRDAGLVEFIKILSGVILKLEEAHGGPA